MIEMTWGDAPDPTEPHPLDTPSKADNERRLAGLFATALRLELGAETFATVVKLNATASPQFFANGHCHSHEFCDANVVMAEGFREVFSRDIDPLDDDDVGRWNAAWEVFGQRCRAWSN